MRTFALLAIADPAALPPGRVAALGQPETRDGAIRGADPPLPGVVITELKSAEGNRPWVDRESSYRTRSLRASRYEIGTARSSASRCCSKRSDR